ncbi:MAG: hypothetical protein JW782_00010 [Candidatus Saganbacteria bacterium]|nr:hypothetical protein [Candidatus Saganbacteria bacterium]
MLDRSAKVFIGMLVLFCLLVIWLNCQPVQLARPEQQALLSWPIALMTVTMGWLGYFLSRKLDIPDLFDKNVSTKCRFIMPALIGIGFGMVLALLDVIFKLPADLNIAWPYSVPYYLQGAIFADIQHFFPIVFLVWLVSSLIMKGRWQARIYWTAAVLISLVEPLQMTRLTATAGPVGAFTIVLAVYIFAVNFMQAVCLKRAGFLSMLSLRLGQYLVWHIIWGALRLPLIF